MNEEKQNDKPIKLKWKIAIIVAVLLIAFIGYGYNWFTNVNRRDQEAKLLISGADYGNKLKVIVQSEYTRCQDFIIQKQGDFGSFEYCKKFIDWTNSNKLLVP